jgi:hypothetical protein
LFNSAAMLSDPPLQIRRVGFWPRALATALDVLILIAFGGAVLLLLQPDSSLPRPVYNDLLVRAHYATQIAAALGWLALTLGEALLATTPGKGVLRFEIANANATKAQPGTLRRRWAFKNGPALLWPVWAATQNRVVLLIAAVGTGLVALGCLLALAPSKQAWHDRRAATAVYVTLNVLVPLPPPAPRRML